MRSLGLGLGLGRGRLTIIGGGAPGDGGGEEPTDTYFTDFSDAEVFEGGQGLEHLQTTQGRRALSFDAPGTAADVDVVADFVFTGDGTGERFGIIARGGGAASAEDGWIALVHNGNGLTLGNYQRGTPDSFRYADASVDFIVGYRYRLRLRLDGSSLQLKVWQVGEDEPASWNIEETDTDLSGAGWVGLFSFADTEDEKYCDYFAVDTGGGTAPLPGESVGPNQYATDFSGQTADAAPSDWTEEWATTGSTWTVVDKAALPPLGWTIHQTPHPWALTADATAEGGQLVTCVPSTANLGFLSANTADALTGREDAEIVVRIKTTASSLSTGQHGGIAVRGTAGGAYRLYFINTSSIRLYAPSGALLATESGVDPRNWAWMRLRAEGTAIKARVWLDGDPEPAAWTIEETDSEEEGAGWIGFTQLQNTAWLYDVVGIATGGATAPTS